MTLFRHKNEIITRNYDHSGAGFSALPTRVEPPLPDGQKLQSNIGTVKDVTALFSSIFLSAIGYGILMVMIALKLNDFVKDEVLMSTSSATQIIAGVIFSRYLPALGRKVGMINTLYLGSLVSAICSILFYFYIDFFFWIFVVFLYGAAAFICGVTRQTVMIDIAPKHMRAMIISWGGMIVAIGNSLGPVFIEIIKTSDSFASFLIACAFFLSSILPLSRLKKIDADFREEKKIGLWRYILNSPKIMFAGFCVNYATSSSNAFLIIYGMKIGMDQSHSSLLVSVFLFGSIFSIPVGYLVDILNRRLLMMVSAFLALICMIFLYMNSNPQKIYTLLFLMFGCLMTTKLSAVVLINEKYKPSQRLAVNSAFSKISLIGNIFGIFLTGSIMRSFGPSGLWMSTILIIVLFLTFCAMNYFHKMFLHQYNIRYFSFFNKQKPNEYPS